MAAFHDLPYDPTTDVGQVRLWIQDTDNSSGSYRWHDAELQVFLNVTTQTITTTQLFNAKTINHMLAAAMALRAEANQAARLAKILKLGTLGINKQTVYKSLLEAAAELEKRAVGVPSTNPADQIFSLPFTGLQPDPFGNTGVNMANEGYYSSDQDW